MPSPTLGPSGPLHIDRRAGPIVDPLTDEYHVTFGGPKDGVGTILVAKPNGLAQLGALLGQLNVPPSEIEIAWRVLMEHPHHEIAEVTLTRATLRALGLDIGE